MLKLEWFKFIDNQHYLLSVGLFLNSVEFDTSMAGRVALYSPRVSWTTSPDARADALFCLFYLI